MVKVKTTMELDSEQFEKYAKFLAWLKKDQDKKAKKEKGSNESKQPRPAF